MATKKPHATISYNTPEFLIERLNYFMSEHIVKKWYFINHLPDWESGKKHIHLYVEFNQQVDIMQFQEQFVEYVVGEDKPRRCMTFWPSKVLDWILYVLHDPDYLLYCYKNRDNWEELCNKLVYGTDDIIKYSDMDFERDYLMAYTVSDFALDRANGKLIKAAIYKRPEDLIFTGQVSLGNANNLRAVQIMARETFVNNEGGCYND